MAKFSKVIKKLVDECSFPNDGGTFTYRVELNEEMFARKIVEMCLDAVHSTTNEGQPLHLVSLGYGARIKEIFGL